MINVIIHFLIKRAITKHLIISKTFPKIPVYRSLYWSFKGPCLSSLWTEDQRTVGRLCIRNFRGKTFLAKFYLLFWVPSPPATPGQETIKQPPHSCYCDETMEGWVGNGGLKPFIKFWWYFHIFIGFSHLWLDSFFGRNWFPVCCVRSNEFIW